MIVWIPRSFHIARVTSPTRAMDWWVLPKEQSLEIGPDVFRAASSGLHVLFGPNNSGKSRILKLLSRVESARMVVPWDAIPTGNRPTLESVRTFAERFGFGPVLVDVRLHDLALNVSDETKSLIGQLHSQFGDRIPSAVSELDGALSLFTIEKPKPAVYIAAHRYLDTSAPIGNRDGNPDNPGEMVQFLSRLQGHADKNRRDRLGRIERAFTEISETTFFLRQSDRWTVHISANGSNSEWPLDDCGDGLRDLLGLILQVEEHPDRAVFIDEPGVRLHPRAQRALLRYLVNAAASRPIWLATHDGVFIGSSDIEHRYAISRRSDVTTARRVTSLKEARLAAGELGWSPRDAFLCDKVLFCEGPSDQIVFSHLLEEPRQPLFQGVEIVELGGDRIWGKDSARLKALVRAVVAVAPHARTAALLDRGGHSGAECDEVERLLKSIGVGVCWLEQGELEDYWLDAEICTQICEALAKSYAVSLPQHAVGSAVAAGLASRAEKGSDTLKGILDNLSLRFSKVHVAKIGVEVFAQGRGEGAKKALLADLVRALRETQ